MLGGIKYIKMGTDLCKREARNLQQKHHEYLKVKPRQTTATFQCHVGTHHPRNLYPDPGRQDLVTGFFFRGVCAPGTSLVDSFILRIRVESSNMSLWPISMSLPSAASSLRSLSPALPSLSNPLPPLPSLHLLLHPGSDSGLRGTAHHGYFFKEVKTLAGSSSFRDAWTSAVASARLQRKE